MDAIAYYLLKVTICSGVLYGYYRAVLHNRTFHSWNRFFLLAAVIISLSFPLIKINIFHNVADQGQMLKLLTAVSTSEYLHEADISKGFQITGGSLLLAAYTAVSIIMLAVMVHTLSRLSRLIRQGPLQKLGHIRILQTTAKGAPFSFFNYVFWNKNIDMRSDTGARIFTHEMVHVTEKHSADKLFMQLVLIVCWCNPFFWLIRREMNMIHEFRADSKAIEDQDTTAFAAMLLHAVYPQQTLGLTSRFFSSSIKRRLFMLKKKTNLRISYTGRLLAIPLLALIFTAFSISTQQLPADQNSGTIAWERPDALITIGPRHHAGTLGNRSVNAKDTLPENVRSVEVTRDNRIIIMYKDNTAEKLTRIEAEQRGLIGSEAKGLMFRASAPHSLDSVLFFLNGAEITRAEMKRIHPNDIESINVLKDKGAVDKYGKRAVKGAIEIVLKKDNGTPEDK